MPVYRGGWGHREAKARFVRELPVSVKNDASVLWGEKSYCKLRRQISDKNLGGGFVYGDYLIYGWKPFSHVCALGFLWGIVFVIVYLIHRYITGAGDAATLGGAYGAWLGAIIAVISGLYAFILPYDRYVVFDRRNQLVHIPRWFSRKQDSVRWEEADFGIIDIRLGAFWNERGTNLYVVKPPHSLLHQGYFSYATAICIHEESKQWHEKTKQGDYVDGAESVFRFIVDFMTRPPERSVALNHLIGMDLLLDKHNAPDRYPVSYRYIYAWLDLDSLPTQPNWCRDAEGQWQQTGKASVIRAGWLGLWGKGMYGKHLKLLPHLKGTRSDPAHHADPNAPLPGSRWITKADGGTGELIGQPAEVIRSILMGEGMPDKASLDATRLPEGGWPGEGSGYKEWFAEDNDEKQ